jgi:hypothetical protein
VRARLTRAWRRLEAFSERPAAGVALVAIALAEYAVVSAAFPLAAGRDLGTYLRASFELRADEVVLPQALLSRAPVTGLVSEALLALGPVAAELAMAALYALAVLWWWRVGRTVGVAPGIALAALVLAYPGYVLLFHRLASDALYAAAFALAALATARFVETRTPGRAVALGLVLALLVLIRPVSQVLIVLAPLLLLGRGAWRPRLGSLAAFGVAAAVPLLLWAGHNAVRADDVTIVRGAGHGLPLYRAFVVDRIVSPENGEASRALARAVSDDLLPREPYRSYEIDLDTFFGSGSARMHEDLIGLADRTWGWDDDYARLARVGREAVRAHPGTYARGVARDAWRQLWWPLFLPPAEDEPASAGWTGYAPIAVSQPPEPTEGQPIPSASVSAFISTPDGRFREVWTSPTAHEILADDPSEAAHLDRLNRRVDELLARFSDRQASAELGRWLDRASKWFPRPALWLALGLVALALRRPASMATPLVLTAAALLVILGTSLAVPADAAYAVPVAPAFMLLAVAGLLSPRRTP